MILIEEKYTWTEKDSAILAGIMGALQEKTPHPFATDSTNVAGWES